MNRLTPEQACLLGLSRMVWDRRQAAKASNLPFNEETITETILLDLKLNYPGEVRITAFNRRQEADNGADWLWSFVSADGGHSSTMLVQAKRLEDTEKRYDGINRNIGDREPPVRQIDQLIDAARRLGVPAIYAFYNHVSDDRRVPQHCQSLPPAHPDHLSGFGISVAAATSVISALPDESFDVHKINSIPLHCLLCSGGSGTRSTGGSPDAAVQALSQLGASTRGEGGRFDVEVRRGLHPSVEFALGFAERRAGEGDEFLADFPRIAGVVVIRDVEMLYRES